MKEIILTRGLVVLVDDDDFEMLSKFKWYHAKTKSNIYAKTCTNNERILMHRLIMKTPIGLDVDHIDHNGLNNQKSNLRNCTRSENLQGSKPKRTLKYKGVSITKRRKKIYFKVSINNNHLGYYKNEIDAAKAYDIKAKELYGEYAYQNFK